MSKLTNLLEKAAKIDPQVHHVFIGGHELFPGIIRTSFKITLEKGLSKNQFSLHLNHPGLGVRMIDLPEIREYEKLSVKWVGEKLHYVSWGNIELHFVESN